MNCPSCNAPEGKPHATGCTQAQETDAGMRVGRVPQTAPSATIPSGQGIVPGSVEDVERLAALVASRPKMRPPGLDSWEEVLIVMRAGMEADLSPLRAIQSLYISQGRVNWYVKNAWGVVCSKVNFESAPDKWIELDGARQERIADLTPEQRGRMVGCFKTQRHGWEEPKITRYTADQAKAQGLWGKVGAWRNTPDRMLLARAESRHLDDWYQDILMGLSTGDVGPLAVVRESPADFEPDALPPPPPEGDKLLDQLEAGGEAGNTIDVTPTPRPDSAETVPEEEEEPPDLPVCLICNTKHWPIGHVRHCPEPPPAEGFQATPPEEPAPKPNPKPKRKRKPNAKPEPEPKPETESQPDDSIPKGLAADQLKAAGFRLCPHCERTLDLISDMGHGEPCK